jgi:hypothetical protein
MANIRPDGGVRTWLPKKPTSSLVNAPLLQPNAMDDPECIPGKDSPYTPFARGTSKPAAPFGLGVPGNSQT